MDEVSAIATGGYGHVPGDTYDDVNDLADPPDEDKVSQRAIAFCHVAKVADAVKDEAVKELCLTMLRKLNSKRR
jgi:hypothetical protein